MYAVTSIPKSGLSGMTIVHYSMNGALDDYMFTKTQSSNANATLIYGEEN